MSGVAPGNAPAPSGGSLQEVIDCWNTHAQTAPSRRVRVRALSRVVAGSEFPTAVLESLAAELG